MDGYGFTETEQNIYDELISKINELLKYENPTKKMTLINLVDALVEELIGGTREW